MGNLRFPWEIIVFSYRKAYISPQAGYSVPAGGALTKAFLGGVFLRMHSEGYGPQLSWFQVGC